MMNLADQLSQPPTPRVVRAPRRSAAPAPEEMEHILNGLGNLNLGDRVVLGDRRNIDNAIQKARQEVHKPEPDHCIVISSDSEDDAANVATPKAQKLNKLTKRALAATDNAALSDIVFEFSRVLKSYMSRSLTKEGFAFLDALYKQLEDPSVFDVTPLR